MASQWTALAKAHIARELFVRTADENYITARWCAMNGLNTDFLWLALHSLEKYMKAVLLLNGQSARTGGHDVVLLYERLQEIALELLPQKLSRPPKLNVDYWKDYTPREYMDRVYENGNPDNRYLIYGYIVRAQDLHMLDRMVFSIRRLVCPLDEARPPSSVETNRQYLRANPAFFASMQRPLDILIAATASSALRTAALNMNIPFAPRTYSHEPIRGGWTARNPEILNTVLERIETDDAETAAEVVEVARWLLENVQIPGGKNTDGVAHQIKAAVEAARKKHKLP
jgi:HEPN domain-containing protein